MLKRGKLFWFRPSRNVAAAALVALVASGAASYPVAALGAGSISISPSSLTVCAAAYNSKTFTASHGSFTQTASSANTAVATVTPPGGPNGSVTYTVTGHSTGTTSINVSDTQGATGSASVNVDGPISVSPATLSFNGTTLAQTITVSDPGPAVLVSASSSDTTVATVVTASATTSANTASFNVTPVNGSKNGAAPATATITFTDAAGCAQRTVSVTVTPGALTTSPTSLTFSGSTTAQTFTASESDYTGPLSALSNNANIATVSGSGSGPGPVSFSVTPTGTAFGSTAITVSDNHSGTSTVGVLVTGGTIVIDSATTTASFGVGTNNSNAHFPATPVHVTGSLQTTSNGSGQIAVISPASLPGAQGSIPISDLTYNCTANSGTGINQGATFLTGYLQLVSGQAPNCATFPKNQLSSLDFFINLFLDDRALPADTYSSGGFQAVLSAT
jgi:hypothetical protein